MNGGDLYVAAINIAIVWSGLRTLGIWLPWVVRVWRRLRSEALGLLPVNVCFLVGWISIESAYFATTRIVSHVTAGEVDMRADEWAVVVWCIRTVLLLSLVAHVIPRWSAMGIRGEGLALRIVVFLTEAALVWAASVWVLGMI